jgi:hypothetical protein
MHVDYRELVERIGFASDLPSPLPHLQYGLQPPPSGIEVTLPQFE